MTSHFTQNKSPSPYEVHAAQMVCPLQYLALGLPHFSPSLNIPSIFWLYSFRAFAIAVPFTWSTLSSDLSGSPSTSASEKEDLLREVFHDYPIHKTSNPFPYPVLFILMYFSIANIPTSCYMFVYLSILLSKCKPQSQILFRLFTVIDLGPECLLAT